MENNWIIFSVFKYRKIALQSSSVMAKFILVTASFGSASKLKGNIIVLSLKSHPPIQSIRWTKEV